LAGREDDVDIFDALNFLEEVGAAANEQLVLVKLQKRNNRNGMGIGGIE